MKDLKKSLVSRKLKTVAYTDERLSKVHYISHHRQNIAKQMNAMLDQALELDLGGHRVAAENYQLMNYGIGGLFIC